MARSTIEHRRKIREVESRRDKLIMQNHKARTELAKTRAELKSLRSAGAK